MFFFINEAKVIINVKHGGEQLEIPEIPFDEGVPEDNI